MNQGGRWLGVSLPPERWHTDPGKLVRGQPVWYVMPERWPAYVVCGGRYMAMVDAHGANAVARLKTTLGAVEVAMARLFAIREEAEREAEILSQFVSGVKLDLDRDHKPYKLVVRRDKVTKRSKL